MPEVEAKPGETVTRGNNPAHADDGKLHRLKGFGIAPPTLPKTTHCYEVCLIAQ